MQLQIFCMYISSKYLWAINFIRRHCLLDESISLSSRLLDVLKISRIFGSLVPCWLELAVEKITVSTCIKTKIINTKTQKYFCIFYKKQTSTQLMTNIFNDFAVKKSQRLKLNVDFVALESNLKKDFRVGFEVVPMLLQFPIFGITNNF